MSNLCVFVHGVVPSGPRLQVKKSPSWCYLGPTHFKFCNVSSLSPAPCVAFSQEPPQQQLPSSGGNCHDRSPAVLLQLFQLVLQALQLALQLGLHALRTLLAGGLLSLC